VVIFLFGLTDLLVGAATFGQGEAPTFKGITGTTWDATKNSAAPAQIDWMVRSQAIWLMLVGALSRLHIGAGFRRGELPAATRVWRRIHGVNGRDSDADVPHGFRPSVGNLLTRFQVESIDVWLSWTVQTV
jgi:hypothetical protein